VEIEPGIKNLVELLNKVPYIETSSSCEGHSEDLEVDQSEKYAHIIFEVPKEKEEEFEKLASQILSATSPHWTDFLVNLHKRYFVVPHGGELEFNWVLKFEPFPEAGYTAGQKREITNQAIDIVEGVLNKYLSMNSYPIRTIE